MCLQISSCLPQRVPSAEVMKPTSWELYLSRCEKVTSLASFHALLASVQSPRRVDSHSLAFLNGHSNSIGGTTSYTSQDHSLMGHGMVCGFKPRESLKLLGKFGAQGLAFCDELVDFCSLFSI